MRKVKLSIARFPCALISKWWRKGILSVYLKMCCLQSSVLLMTKSYIKIFHLDESVMIEGTLSFVFPIFSSGSG